MGMAVYCIFHQRHYRMPAFGKSNHDVGHFVAKELSNMLTSAMAMMYTSLCREGNVHLLVFAIGNGIMVNDVMGKDDYV